MRVGRRLGLSNGRSASHQERPSLKSESRLGWDRELETDLDGSRWSILHVNHSCTCAKLPRCCASKKYHFCHVPNIVVIVMSVVERVNGVHFCNDT